MQEFINSIWTFVSDVYGTILNTIVTSSSANFEKYNAFVGTQILSGELISLGMTWRDLFLYGTTWFLVIFFIVAFIKLCYKVLGLFKL